MTTKMRAMLTAMAVTAVASSAQAASYGIVPTVPRYQAAGEVLSEFVIAKQPGRYIGWPDVVQAANGDLLAVFSGDRDAHLDPWGKIFTVRSTDGGLTWDDPVMVVDTPLDDRGSSLLALSDGTLMLTFGAALDWDNPTSYPQYQDYAQSLTPEVRQQWKGEWMMQSTDHGQTWGPLVKQPTRVPHGPIELADGRLLLAKASVYESHDRGQTWSIIASNPRPDDWGSNNAYLSEPHAVELPDGKIIMLSRYNDTANGDYELRQLESTDGGVTWNWGELAKTGMQGYPPHVMTLDNGWLLATYGRRQTPRGQRATISMDGGQTWLTQDEMVLSNAVPQGGSHLGYPSSVQLDDGSIFTIYYQIEKASDGNLPSLMGTLWRPYTDATGPVLFRDHGENVAFGDAPLPVVGSYSPAETRIVAAGVGTNSLGLATPGAPNGGDKLFVIDPAQGGNLGRRTGGVLREAATGEVTVRFEFDLVYLAGAIAFGIGDTEDLVSNGGGSPGAGGIPLSIQFRLNQDGEGDGTIAINAHGQGDVVIDGVTHTVGQWQHYVVEYDLGTGEVTLIAGEDRVTVPHLSTASGSLDRIDRVFINGPGSVGYFDNLLVTLVPEPTSTALCGIALLTWCGRRERRIR